MTGTARVVGFGCLTHPSLLGFSSCILQHLSFYVTDHMAFYLTKNKIMGEMSSYIACSILSYKLLSSFDF